MATWATASARQACALPPRLSGAVTAMTSSSRATCLLHRRGLAGGSSDHHGPQKVNFWEDPLHPSRWKEEHFVIGYFTGWGLLFYGGYRYFLKGKNEDKQEKVRDGSC